MDHPLKADVATTRRALSKQHDPPGATTAAAEADASTNTHGALTRAARNGLLQYTGGTQNAHNGDSYLRTTTYSRLCLRSILRYGREDITWRGAVDKIRSA